MRQFGATFESRLQSLSPWHKNVRFALLPLYCFSVFSRLASLPPGLPPPLPTKQTATDEDPLHSGTH